MNVLIMIQRLLFLDKTGCDKVRWHLIIVSNALILSTLLYSGAMGQAAKPFQYSTLNYKGDLSSLMIQGIDSFLMSQTKQIALKRSLLWKRDFSSEKAFNQSILSKRKLLEKLLGIADQRVHNPKMVALSNSRLEPFQIILHDCTIRAVRWDVLAKAPGLSAEGLLIEPKTKVKARVIMIPDADVKPEQLAGIGPLSSPGFGVARRLANIGCEVLIPVLVSRQDTFSGNPLLKLYTNQPHREWIYRQGYEVGRHVIGYELQKIFSAIDWMEGRNQTENDSVRIGVAGYGEGGELALYSAALDTRISSTLVSGYFNARENLWREPIYRNVFGLLKTFGDAEIAVMAWPRLVTIEQSKAPEINGPPVSSKRRSGAAPGRLITPDYLVAKKEWDRAVSMIPTSNDNLKWCAAGESTLDRPYSNNALRSFTGGLGIRPLKNLTAAVSSIRDSNEWVDTIMRQKRTVRGMQQLIQHEVILCEQTRDEEFWQVLDGKDTSEQTSLKSALRDKFWNQIGKLPYPSMSFNPRAKLLHRGEKWSSYEVMLDVWPGVFAWGILLIPNQLKPGARYPVVVCQHGLEGVPMDVVTTDPNAENYHFYQGFASRLADKGYIVFAPCNLYRGGNKFRVLQRKANPIGLTLFSIIVGQHQRIVDWLKQLPFVDPARIGFYGLSYGGKTAMRVPAIVEGYSLSICSGDFNEWIRKCASTDYNFSYMYNGEYDMQEWDLGHTFSYAEMAALIAPRPFMVERGHFDGVARDEWVGYEFAKVRRHYDLIGLPRRARIEYFNGPHTINGKGTFDFLNEFLRMDGDH